MEQLQGEQIGRLPRRADEESLWQLVAHAAELHIIQGEKYERRIVEEKAAEGKRAAGALSLVCKTARSAVIEIADGGKYFTKKPYRVTVNAIEELVTERTITPLYGLRPDTDYLVESFDGEEKCGELFFHTDYQSVPEEPHENRACQRRRAPGIHGEGAFSGAARAD